MDWNIMIIVIYCHNLERTLLWSFIELNLSCSCVKFSFLIWFTAYIRKSSKSSSAVQQLYYNRYLKFEATQKCRTFVSICHHSSNLWDLNSCFCLMIALYQLHKTLSLVRFHIKFSLVYLSFTLLYGSLIGFMKF